MPVFRRIVGMSLLCVGAWLLWRTFQALSFEVARTGNRDVALMDPVFFLPLMAAGASVIGGFFAAQNWPTGGIFGLIGAVLMALFALLVTILIGNQDIFLPRMIDAGLLSAHVLLLLRMPRKR